MKLKFKHQTFQSDAVRVVIDCFKGQPQGQGIRYRLDPGVQKNRERQMKFDEDAAFRNPDIILNEVQILENIQAVQKRQNLPISPNLVQTSVSSVNLDIEMETGTGKTYCYIKTIYEMNNKYGWNKFIIVVPSIAIREGVYKSFEITAEHFLESYGKKIKFFIYNSKQLHNLESFSSDAGINVMIINVQAFNATGKDARRIYEELDDGKVLDKYYVPLELRFNYRYETQHLLELCGYKIEALYGDFNRGPFIAGREQIWVCGKG